MTTRPSIRIAAALGTTALLGLGPVGLAGAVPVDYSKNAAGGQYAPARVSAPAVDYTKNAAGGLYAPDRPAPAIDYTKNAAGGSFAPAARGVPGTTPAPSPDEGGVDWGVVIAGAGIGLVIAFTAVGGRTVARRRRVMAG
jgi:hypothetical protein